MSQQWYYGRSGQHSGPISSQALKELANCGKLLPSDLVWKDGLSEWVEAKKIKGLFPPEDPDLVPSELVPEAVTVSCGNCNARFKIDESAIVGNRVSCKACGIRIVARPDQEQSVEVSIPKNVVSSRELTEEEISIVRIRLSRLAQEIPNHDIDNFGNAIDIEQAQLIPCYWMEINTLYEQRIVERQEAPFLEQEIPPLTVNEGNVLPWSYSFIERTDFEEFHDDLRVEDSQSVHACDECSETGSVTCPDCEGNGRVQCPDCDGTTNVSCPQCRGQGVVKRQRQIPAEERCYTCFGRKTIETPFGGYSPGEWQVKTCPQCYGRGFRMGTQTEYYSEPCNYCGTRGRVRCDTCNASGIMTCRTCYGDTRITCPRCDGRTQIVSYLTILRHLAPALLVNTSVDGELEDLVQTQLFGKLEDKDDLPIVEFVGTTRIDLSLKELPQSISAPILAAEIQNLLMEASDRADEQTHIAYQACEIRQTIAYLIRYTFGDQQYIACALGQEADLLPLRTPFTDLAQSALQTALELWSQGSKNQAIENFNLYRCIAAREEATKESLKEYQHQIPLGLKTAASANSMLIAAKAGFFRGATTVSETIDSFKNSKLGKWLGGKKDD